MTALGLRQTILLALLMISVSSALFITTSQETPTNDVYWHIKVGEQLVKTGEVPRVDSFSFSHLGEPVKVYPLIFDAVIYLLVDTFGYESGSHAYMFGTFLILLLLVCHFALRRRANLLTVSLAVITVGLLYNFRLLVRPELGIYLFIAFSFYLYRRTTENVNWKSYTLNFLFLALWSSYHGAIVGYVIFFGMYIDIGIKLLKDRSPLRNWLGPVLSGVALLIAGYCNPYFAHPLIEQFTFDPRWTEVIQEYRSIFLQFGPYLGLGPLSLFFIFGIMLSVKAKEYGYIFIQYVLFATAISVSRMLPYAILAALMVIIDLLTRHDSPSKDISIEKFRTYGTALFFAFFTVFLGIVAATYRPTFQHNPHELANYFLAEGYSGNIINPYSIGGYLIYRPHPQAMVFFDGRSNILYDFDFFQEANEINMNSTLLKEAALKYQADFLVMPDAYDGNRNAYASGLYSLDFVDNQHLLYVRNDANFRYSGFVYGSPYCWKNEFNEAIAQEQEIAETLKGLNPQYLEFLHTLVQYANSAESLQFIRKQREKPASNASFRFLAYQAMHHGDFELAYAYFASLINFQSKDYLAAAYSKLMLNDFPGVEDVLRKTLDLRGVIVEDADRVLMVLLMQRLLQEGVLSDDLDSIYRQLTNYLKSINIVIESHLLDTTIFCGQGLAQSETFSIGQLNPMIPRHTLKW